MNNDEFFALKTRGLFGSAQGGQYRRFFQIYFCISSLITILGGFSGCKKETPVQKSIEWFLNHDDSMVCERMDKKNSLTFFYTDSNQNYFKLIYAYKVKSEHIISNSKGQDPDPSRNSGASVKIHYMKYFFMDSLNKFPIEVSIFPTFSMSGIKRLNSTYKIFFNNGLQYSWSIYKNGLPNNFIVYDSLNYNGRLYKKCNYNKLALERNLGLTILDSTAFPVWIENRSQKIYIDFKN